MTRRRHIAAAVGLLAGSACGHQPVTVQTVGTTSTSSPSTTEATTTTEAPATTAAPNTTLAPEVEVPPTSALLASGAGATTTPTTVRRTTTTEATADEPTPTVYEPAPAAASGACGGVLPPCSVMRRESGGDPTAVNATGCGGRGCYGKWQADPRTSQALGYPGVMTDYSEAVQDEFARRLWAGGAGCAHWNAC